MSYIRTVDIVYGDSTNAIDGQDVNKGFGGTKTFRLIFVSLTNGLLASSSPGQYVYLVPRYTADKKKACCGFSLFTSYNEDLTANDMAKGDGKDLYRYLHVHYDVAGNHRTVGKVYLKEETMGDGHTDDLNKDRGGRFLYLCWEYVN